MSPSAVLTGWEPLLIGLIVLILLLFAVASWTGRWSLWLGGWAAAAITLIGVFLMRGTS